MAKKAKRGKKIKKKLLHKYRLVVLNEDTFEERFSFKLNRLNVFVFVLQIGMQRKGQVASTTTHIYN